MNADNSDYVSPGRLDLLAAGLLLLLLVAGVLA
jgi:hypothetical protein